MADKKMELKAIDVWQVSVKWYGEHRLSPEYPSIEEALNATAPFLKKFNGKFLQVTYVRNQRWVPAG